MSRMWLIAFWVALLVPASHADRLLADITADYGDNKLVQAELVLRQAVEFWESNPDVSMIGGHLALRSIAKDIPGLRSIIAVDRDGQLAFDSYNPTLFSVDLSDRAYFGRANNQDDASLVIAPVVVGRHSGQPFLPLAKRVGSGRVMMASFVTTFLFPKVELCAFCGVAAIHDGEIVSSAPSLQPPAGLPNVLLKLDTEYGGQRITVDNIIVTVHWRRSKILSKLIYVFYDASPYQ